MKTCLLCCCFLCHWPSSTPASPFLSYSNNLTRNTQKIEEFELLQVTGSEEEAQRCCLTARFSPFVSWVKPRFLYVSCVFFPLLSLIWDTCDVGLDLCVFYQLEKGDLLDDVIHRNIYVNNAIFAFAVLGMVKMLLCVMWDEPFVVTLLPYYPLESQVD